MTKPAWVRLIPGEPTMVRASQAKRAAAILAGADRRKVTPSTT